MHDPREELLGGGGSLRPVVWRPICLAGAPGQEEIPARGDGHIAAVFGSLDVGEGALVVGCSTNAYERSRFEWQEGAQRP